MTTPLNESSSRTPEACNGQQPVEKLVFALSRSPVAPAPWLPLKEPQEALRTLFSFDIGAAPVVRTVFVDAYLNLTVSTRGDAQGSRTGWNRVEGALALRFPSASGGPRAAEIVRLSDTAGHGKQPNRARSVAFHLNAEVVVPADQGSQGWWCDVQFAHEGNSYVRFEADGLAGSSRVVFTHFIEGHALRIQQRSSPRTES